MQLATEKYKLVNIEMLGMVNFALHYIKLEKIYDSSVILQTNSLLWSDVLLQALVVFFLTPLKEISGEYTFDLIHVASYGIHLVSRK